MDKGPADGAGLDEEPGVGTCSFASTVTRVVLMSVNTTVGFLWREFGMVGVEAGARPFLSVCMSMVVVGAPLGAICGSYLYRLTLAWLVYIIDAAQLIRALPRRLSTAGRYRGGM